MKLCEVFIGKERKACDFSGKYSILLQEVVAFYIFASQTIGNVILLLGHRIRMLMFRTGTNLCSLEYSIYMKE